MMLDVLCKEWVLRMRYYISDLHFNHEGGDGTWGEYSIERFVKAHRIYFDAALSELRAGHKESHWMWFIFPQIRGLGCSEVAEYYAILDFGEAKAYLQEPVLAAHMQEICEALLRNKSSNAEEVMGWPDDLKLRSSMTLFMAADPGNDIYQKILDKFFDGRPDEKTLEILQTKNPCV